MSVSVNEMTPILFFIPQREQSDCAVACLAMYLGVSYEDALRAVVEVDPKYKGRTGLWPRQIKKAAEILGHPLIYRRKVNLEDDYGILKIPTHAVVLRNGLVFDPGTQGIWDVGDYLATVDTQPMGIYQMREAGT